MNETVIIAVGLAVLSIASGMLGLGVAFAAVSFLGFFMTDLVHEVQPLSLFLNGITALFSLFGFARSGLVMWKPAILLAVVTTVKPLSAHGSPSTFKPTGYGASILLPSRSSPGACSCLKKRPAERGGNPILSWR